MKIRILCVGKIKETFYNAAIAEYLKRLQNYAKIEIVEVGDEAISDKSNENLDNKIKEKEGEKLLSKIGEKDFVVLLNLNKKLIDSVAFAKEIEFIGIKGFGTIDFVIGGSLGLGENIIKRANDQISISNMTFTHQMCRIILLEQIYRAFKILNNETYHK